MEVRRFDKSIQSRMWNCVYRPSNKVVLFRFNVKCVVLQFQLYLKSFWNNYWRKDLKLNKRCEGNLKRMGKILQIWVGSLDHFFPEERIYLVFRCNFWYNHIVSKYRAQMAFVRS